MPGRFTGKRGVFSGKTWSWQLGQTLDEILLRIQQGMANLQKRPRTPLTLSLNVASDAGVGPAPALDDHKHELDLGLSVKGDLPSHTGAAYATVTQGPALDGYVLKKDSTLPAGMKWDADGSSGSTSFGGVPSGLANANTEGVSTVIPRLDHQHKRDVRVKVDGVDVATRNALDFRSSPDFAMSVVDDPANDVVAVSLSNRAPDAGLFAPEPDGFFKPEPLIFYAAGGG